MTAPDNYGTRKKRVMALTAAGLITLTTLTGCAKVVDGQLSMQIEPLSSDISCREFVALSENDRLKIVTQILGESSSPNEPSPKANSFVMVTLAGVLCQGMPDMPVKSLLGRMRVR